MKPLLRIDPSSLLRSDCTQHFNLSNIQGHTPLIPRHAMEYGVAFHHGVAEFLKGKTIQESVSLGVFKYLNSNCVVPEKDFRDSGHLHEVLKGYFNTYAVGDLFKVARNPQGVPAVELPFAIPWKSYDSCDVIICGIVDALGTYGFGSNAPRVIKDIKTTQLVMKTSKQYFSEYDCHIQMMLYSWAVKNLGWTDYYPPVVIDGVFLKSSGSVFERSSLIDIQPEHVDSMILWLDQKINDIVKRFENSIWTKNPTQCHPKFGRCQFFQHCWGMDEGWIDRNFTTRVYDPAKFQQ